MSVNGERFAYECHLLIIFTNSLDPDQARQNVGPDLDPNCLTLWNTPEKFFGKNDLDEEEPILMCLCFVWFESLRPSQQFFSYVGTGLPVLNQYSARINVSYSRIQCSSASETRTSNPSVSSQALYYWATGDQRSYSQSILSIHNKASIYITSRTSEQ